MAASGCFRWRRRAPSPRQLRLAWLTELVRAIHADSRGTDGWRRVNAELVYGRGVVVNPKTVGKILRLHGLHGLPGSRKLFGSKATIATTADLVDRQFSRTGPNQLWVTDITEHPTREGKLYCWVVLEGFSRRVVGWAIDSHQATPLVTNALGHGQHQPQPAARADGDPSRSRLAVRLLGVHPAGQGRRLLPSMGTVGDADDNAVIESFWARMQTELLDRRRWITRIELANAIFEYLEIFHNRQRRHSALGWRTSVEFEKLHATDVA